MSVTSAWIVPLFDAVRSGDILKVEGLMKTHQVTKNLSHPDSQEALLDVATTIRNQGIRLTMIDTLRVRIGLKSSSQ